MRGAAARLVAAALAWAALGCGGTETVLPPRLVRVERRVIREVTRFHGRLEPVEKVAVKSPYDSTLLSWAEHGLPTKAGDAVAEVDAVPVKQTILVLEASLESSALELEVAEYEAAQRAAVWEEKLRAAELRLEKARTRYRSQVEARDWVGILRDERDQEVDAKKLERLRRELGDLAPQVEKGFVSETEAADIRAEIVQLELGMKRRGAELALKRAGPAQDKVVDLALEVAKAEAQVEKVRRRAAAQVQLAQGPVKRAREAVRVVREQLAEKRETLASCVLRAPADGVFLQNQGSQWMGFMKVRPGSRLWSSFPAGWVATGGRCRLEFWVHESQLPRLEVGRALTFQVLVDSRDRFPATITEVARVAWFDAAERRRVKGLKVTASVDLDPGEYGPIRPGLNAVVELEEETAEEVLALPAEALRGEGVVLASGEHRAVRLGRVGLAWAEVLEGVLPGEDVLVPGTRRAEARVVAATRGDLREVYEEGGTLSADGQQVLYNNEAQEWRTKITWMAEEGSDVTSGTVVVKLDPGEFANQLDTVAEELAQAEAGLAKADAEGRAAEEGKEKAVQVAEAELRWLEATLATVLAGSAPEEKAKAAAKLAELEVDAEALGKKFEVTAKMAGRGFAGQRELSQLEEQFLRAKARVEVAALEKKLVDLGATPSERALAKLDVADARHRLEVAQREFREAAAKASLDRRAAQARVRAKREEQTRKQRQLEGYNLTAGRDGTVVFLRHEEDGKQVPFKTGSFARRGEGVVAIADLSRSRIEGLVSEEVAWRVAQGAAATFWLPSFPDERYQAEVLRIGRLPREIPEGEGEQGFDVELRVTKRSARLQPGQRVRFAIELDRVEGAVLVPLTAVLREEGENLVVLEDGTRRRVEVGPRDTTNVAILKGLEEGERVLAY